LHSSKIILFVVSIGDNILKFAPITIEDTTTTGSIPTFFEIIKHIGSNVLMANLLSIRQQIIPDAIEITIIINIIGVFSLMKF